jgi:hypothetical protein
MQKTIKDMALFLQNLLPPEIPKTFAIDTMFYTISNEENIRKGVYAFKDFMYQLYGRLVTEGGSFDKPKKEAHAFSDNTNIAASYPFICNITVILTNIGLHGALSENRDSILLDSVQKLSAENNICNTNISDARKIECLRFLAECGINIDGIDLSGKKPDFATLRSLVISYPKKPAMLTGLKVMATAQRKLSSSVIQDIFLRCDYRVLANKDIDNFSALKDLINPLPVDVRKFVIKLHQDYMEKGYKCVYSTTNFYIRFTYFCRSKELWRLNVSLNNGYNIGIKANNTDKYPDTLKTFPEWLQEKIVKGYGCGKKRRITTSCDGGCRGFRVPLDDSFMEISSVIETWINKELSCLQRK